MKATEGKTAVPEGKKTTIIKSCYSHLGGKFGNALAEHLLKTGWIRHDSRSRDFAVTAKGSRAFKKMGMDLSKL